MRGGFIHNTILLVPIESFFRDCGASISREFKVPSLPNPGFIDLLIRFDSALIACEAELSPKRVVNDLHKALVVQAHLLLIITPNAAVTRSCYRKIRAQQAEINHKNLAIYVFSVGTAREWLKNCFLLFSKTILPQKTKKQIGDIPHLLLKKGQSL